MENWHKRLKEIREKYNKTQQDLAVILGKDVTRMSRYERGEGAKNMPAFMKTGLLSVFSKKDIEYIETGEKCMEIDKDFGVCKMEDSGELYRDLPKDTAMIMELLHELTTEQRRKVLHYILELTHQ